jgi:hypothetical protein
VWPVQLSALEVVVGAVEMMDTEAAAEQAGGSDEEGGTMTAFFNDTVIPVGDLNRSNFHRKVDGLRDPRRGGLALPCGGTKVGPAVQYLDGLTLEEFWKDEETGLVVPVPQRPWNANALFTDGAMTDYREFVARLEMDRKKCRYLDELEQKYQGLWPGEHWFCGIFGQGDEHDETVKLYQSIAKDFANLHVYDFAGVQSGPEAGEDMAYAMLNRK